ncbi:MAG: YqeG family HAD IIIA-type phosphatase [Clostridiales bacterium]|jgi:HAD superfamily phosphatase (TIGR01668 family)|nr:YqeG family HAD IIIA-type phosphatase [Clostridiales bacterium]
MIKKFFDPDYMEKDIFCINYKSLYENNIRGLIFDIDNTVIAYDNFLIDEKTRNLFKELNKKKFMICFLSNNKEKRVLKFSKEFKIYAFHGALKPLPFVLKKAIKYFKLQRNQIVLIGDQIFTDILCGKICGIKTILVNPIKLSLSRVEKFKRWIEKKILEFLNNKRT